MKDEHNVGRVDDLRLVSEKDRVRISDLQLDSSHARTIRCRGRLMSTSKGATGQFQDQHMVDVETIRDLRHRRSGCLNRSADAVGAWQPVAPSSMNRDVAALRAGAVMRRRSLAGQARSLRSGPSPPG